MAALLAAAHPERTRSLVLYGAYSRALWAPDYPFGQSAELLDQFLEMVDARWGDGVGWGEWAPSCADDVRVRTWWARMQRAAASPGMVRSLFALYPQIDVRGRTGDHRCSHARAAPPRRPHGQCRDGRYLAEHIPGAMLVELEGIDHFYWVGDADAILDEIEEFLTGLRRGSEPDRVLATCSSPT